MAQPNLSTRTIDTRPTSTPTKHRLSAFVSIDARSEPILKKRGGKAHMLTQGTPAQDEIINFLAAGVTPESLIAFQLSEETKERVADLIFREKNTTLSAEERAELDQYLLLEHILRLAKARAHGHMAAH
jgi:hypothetical protein